MATYSPKEYKEKVLPALIQKGLQAAAKVLLAEATQRVPIHTGALRRSGKVIVQNGEVFITYGNSNVKYAAKQYFVRLGHVMASGEPQRLVPIFDDGKRASGKSTPYSRAYYLATNPTYKLTKVNKLAWLERQIKVGSTQTRMRQAFVNSTR